MSKSGTGLLASVCFLTSLFFTMNAIGAEAPSESDFIHNLPPLKPSPNVKGAYFWNAPDVSLATYDRLLIDPIEVFVHEESKYAGIAPAEMLAVTAQLRAQLIDALEPDYPVVNKPGPGVARVRLAITGIRLIKQEKVAKGVFAVLPVGLAVNVLQEAAGRKILPEDAAGEIELLDSTTGARLAVGVDPKALRHGGKPSWEALNEALKLYAMRLRQRLDEAHAK